MKLLVIGDVHAEPHALDDCAVLLGLVMQIANESHPDFIVFEGDQHHTHSIVHVDVLAFWKTHFANLKNAGHKVIALVGNHDMTGTESNNHSMMAYAGDIQVVDKPTVISGILFMPYYSNPNQFVADCNAHPECPTVICHQTFQGGTYENGFYAKDGLDCNLIPQEQVVSGHIHRGQTFGKVIYTGSSRWRTLSDANEEKAIFTMEFENGHLLSKKTHSTGICRKIWHLVDTPENPITQQIDEASLWRIDIHGPPEYIQAKIAELQAPNVRIRTFPYQRSEMMQVRESEGIASAFRKFMDRYQARFGTSRNTLEAMVKERLS